MTRIERGDAELPPGCAVTYDLEAVEILRALLRLPKDEDAIRFYYEDFRERYGVRPTATEMHHEGYRPRSVRKAYGSWFGFVETLGDLIPEQQRLVGEGRAGEFVSALETTPMTRSYKMLVLLAMLHADRIPGEITIEELRDGVRRVARRSAALQRDLGVPLGEDAAVEKMLKENPIAAWAGGKGTGGDAYFEFQADVLRTTFSIDASQREAFAGLVQELADWRLAEYLDRPGAGLAPFDEPEGSFVCRVSHAGGQPILFLPPRGKHPSIPSGWTSVQADNEDFEANFVKVAVNVMRRPESEANVLADLLRKWFGKDAGLPGTGHQVRFRPGEGKLSLAPLPRVEAGAGLEVGRSYMRAEIPPAFGLEFKRTVWEQGFVFPGDQIFLLVTIDKSGMPKEHRYGDRFLARDLFEWKSQNRHKQGSKHGQAIRNHADRNIPVHLLARKSGKIGGKAAPFIYCGEVDFVDWRGEKPITVQWRLKQPLSDRLYGLLDSGES